MTAGSNILDKDVYNELFYLTKTGSMSIVSNEMGSEVRTQTEHYGAIDL